MDAVGEDACALFTEAYKTQSHADRKGWRLVAWVGLRESRGNPQLKLSCICDAR